MSKRAEDRPRRRIIIGGSVLIGVAVCALIWFLWPDSSPTTAPTWAVVPVEQQGLVAQVVAGGTIAPEQNADLVFATSGIVAEIPIGVGDDVTDGMLLARLEGEQERIELERAQAQLDQAQGNYAQLAAGATPQELDAAQAQVATAQGNLQQTLGNVTSADITAAQAQVNQAQAALDQLLAGPKSTDVQTAQAQLDSAVANRSAAQASLDQASAGLEQSRNTLSATKTQAESSVTLAANTVRDRQADFARISGDNQRLRDRGIDPPQAALDAENAAQLAINNAQLQLANTQVAYDTAKQNEITGLEQAQAQVTQAQSSVTQADAQVSQAQARLASLTSSADAAQLAQAQANLASARASLNRLQGDSRAGSINAAQGNVAQAQANLERISAEKSSSALAVSDAQVRAAQASRDLAQLQVTRTELRAPFAGRIANVDLAVGEQASRGTVTLVDLSTLHLDAVVDEIDVARVAIGQPVSITLDALPEVELAGKIKAIAPLAKKDSSGATTYALRIDLVDPQGTVLPGMSATAEIEIARTAAALVVPRRALRQEGGRTFVDRVSGPAAPGARPPTVPVEVTMGLVNEQYVEILTGLQAGDEVLVEGINANYDLSKEGF